MVILPNVSTLYPATMYKDTDSFIPVPNSLQELIIYYKQLKTDKTPTLLELVTSYMTITDLDSTHEEKGYTFDINNGLITKIYQKDEIRC